MSQTVVVFCKKKKKEKEKIVTLIINRNLIFNYPYSIIILFYEHGYYNIALLSHSPFFFPSLLNEGKLFHILYLSSDHL